MTNFLTAVSFQWLGHEGEDMCGAGSGKYALEIPVVQILGQFGLQISYF